MRKLIILALLGCAMFVNSVKAQDKDELYDFVSVQKQPMYPGGIAEFYQYVKKEIKYPEAAKNNKTEGKVFLAFTIEKDGSTSDITVIRSLSPETDKEAVRVLKNSPKWAAAEQDGKAVRVRYNININFDLSKISNEKKAAIINRDAKTPLNNDGIKGLYSYLAKNIKYPAEAQKNNTQGKVGLAFNVEEDGSLSDITVTESLSKETDAEAIRVLKKAPKWATIKNNELVRTQYNINVNFDLPQANSTKN
ncbi:energy transducer TonB [Pedobacter kyungheensis]|uniref:energy transducer TonB n=1 Tax=Pedobacter kyungheensis TaxID=1069985 RepID=UPI00068F168F|nr:energy transducer TonB [Pedobacter kyungheensis]